MRSVMTSPTVLLEPAMQSINKARTNVVQMLLGQKKLITACTLQRYSIMANFAGLLESSFYLKEGINELFLFN